MGYAISVDLTPPRRAEIARLPETVWQLDAEEADAIREWTEAPGVPDDGNHRKDRPCVPAIRPCGFGSGRASSLPMGARCATAPLRRTGRSAGIAWRRTVRRGSSKPSTAEIQVKLEVKGQVEAEIRHSLAPGEADVG
jgi:hypothetical protein